MFFFLTKSLLFLSVLATSAPCLVSAAPFQRSPATVETSRTTLSFVTKVNASGHSNIAETDRARVAFMLSGLDSTSNLHSKRTFSSSALNGGVTYTTSIGIGTPPTQYTLLIDTGSSNTWVGAGKKYKPTTSAKGTGLPMSVSYGSGSWSGSAWRDTLTLAPNVTVSNMTIDVDGILGLGPADLTMATLNNSAETSIPTITDVLYSSRVISTEVLGVYFTPASNSTNSSSAQGELSWGAPDTSKMTGPVAYVPVSKTAPSNQSWGIDQSVSYGGVELLKNASGIVDTGTTLVLLEQKAFKAYQNATGATLDPKTGLLSITDASKLQPLSFHIGSDTYTLSANAQLWPRTMNSDIGGVNGKNYLVVASAGPGAGLGLDFVMGYSFLERFYSIYDTTNNRVGFAPTQYTNAITN
ncbi:acid protease [Athelia psychrophila]|uniref:Acid protease n=1 Tax=Athelia psychrophila TaxID=1759441 RepID=A0A166IB77_9AGAM|nr:acid protease [Fibularhizoctonia sp. CBS 109695]